VLYRSPSQNSSEFNDFLSGFENMLNIINSFKPDFTIILGDFNARSKSWWQNDLNSIEGTKIDALASYHGLHQLISEPTHILANSSSCIDPGIWQEMDKVQYFYCRQSHYFFYKFNDIYCERYFFDCTLCVIVIYAKFMQI